jgi:hypothetical protein
MSGVGDLGKSGVRVVLGARELAARERRRLLAEFGEVRGLMPLLIKPRNHQKWTREDRTQLAAHLKRASMLSPYLMLLIMPGGFFALPALAWWLDRRRGGARAH